MESKESKMNPLQDLKSLSLEILEASNRKRYTNTTMESKESKMNSLQDLKSLSLVTANNITGKPILAAVLERKASLSDVRQGSTKKKRKSDEVNVLFDPHMNNPNERAALKTEDIFFDMNPRWRRAYMQELHRKKESEVMQRDMIMLCPDNDYIPAEPLDEDDESSRPTFRESSMRRSVDGDGDSPRGVDDFQCGRVYFWHRSLAWSEDGDEKKIPSSSNDQEVIRNRLSVPMNLGKEFSSSPSPSPSSSSTSTTPAAKKPLASFSLRSLPSSQSRETLLEQCDLDHATFVHWEEKVVNFDLEMIAQLSL
jgi:hypothetical protein